MSFKISKTVYKKITNKKIAKKFPNYLEKTKKHHIFASQLRNKQS